MKLKKMLSLLGFLGMILCSAGASASIVNIQAVPVNNLIPGTTVSGDFDNYWTFFLGANNGFTSQVNDVLTQSTKPVSTPWGIFDYTFDTNHITGLSLELYTASLSSNVNSPLSYTQVLGNTSSSLTSLAFTSLAVGNYALRVTGTGDALSNKNYPGSGRYAGAFSVIPPMTPVPTPQTWTLLLVGSIMLGSQMRRNNVVQDSMQMAA